MSRYQYVDETMIGRVAMSAEDAELVERYAARCKTWVEIGTLWGGSALLAALANPTLQVTCIDPMNGYYGEGEKDPWVGPSGDTPSANTFAANLALFGVTERVHLVAKSSIPWPLSPDFRPDAVLVDGDHAPESVLLDCLNAVQYARCFILVHDIDDPSVLLSAQAAIQWPEINHSSRMKVYGHE